MSDSVPRWRSIGLIDLFRFGPWEIIVPFWVLSGTLMLVWLSNPVFRILVVTTPLFAAVAGGGLSLLTVTIVVKRIFSRLRSIPAMACILLGTVMGAVAAYHLASQIFGPLSVRASICAPLIVTGESLVGFAASLALPILLWLAWCRYLILGFPPLESFEHLSPHTGASRYEPYRASLLKLPLRLVVSIVCCLCFWQAVSSSYKRYMGVVNPENLLSALAKLPAFAIARRLNLSEHEVFDIVNSARTSAAKKAALALSKLQFDAARPLISDAACRLRLPGVPIDLQVLAAESAFQLLDNEISSASGIWLPTAAAVQAMADLLPIGPEAESGAVCPLFWPSAVPQVVPRPVALNELDWFNMTASYRGNQLMDVRLVSLSNKGAEPVTLEVAIRIAGVVGDDSKLVQRIQGRLGARPVEGPKNIGRGALCALWVLDGIGIRVGPAVGPQIPENAINPSAPLWITCYDERLGHHLDQIYKSGGHGLSWDPHRCGLLRSSSEPL